MLAAVLLMLSLGFITSVALAVASRVFYIWEDPTEVAIADTLPGANCGACGYPGCRASATAIAAKQAPVNVCMVGGFEVAQVVGEIMGLKVHEKEPEFAAPGCTYGLADADTIYAYHGLKECRAATLLFGGTKVCPIGCIGLGTCANACPFDALSMGDDDLPVVNLERCVGCGTCVNICPKNIITLSSVSRRILDEYATDECTSPCERACPTGINIRSYMREIKKGNYDKALLHIKEKCPLPLICGYICPAPCELDCRRNLVDEPVAINLLKRFAADYEMATGNHINPYKCPTNGRRIALVGGGAEGLTTAYYLARLGYQPTIFEAKAELGGALRYVIAGDRLPLNVLDHEIKGILEIGVSARTNAAMGRDFTVMTLLQEGFDAVVLTLGGFDSRKILHPDKIRYDAPFRGLYVMLDFLAAQARGEALEIGKQVAIVDSGTKSLEVARRCLTMGAKKVIIITNQPFHMMPNEFEDTLRLRAEGIEVRASAAVVEIAGMAERLDHITLQDMDPRRKSMEVREVIRVDTLVIAAARLPELVVTHVDNDSTVSTDEVRWQTIEMFRTFPAGSNDGIFSSPEPGRISDSAAVVKSILSGRRLTRAIDQHFNDEQIGPIENLIGEADDILDVDTVHTVNACERQRPVASDVDGDSKTAWIFPEAFPGLAEEDAQMEAGRCLQCGLICYLKSPEKEYTQDDV
jgi:NADPH-dependent glutamate synthase beta subunit-like oxidoreductase/ferredoxin-like protein FixX